MNAMKSTGPRSAEGKKRSSANSRRHGLAKKASSDETGKWLDVILGDTPEDLDMAREDERFHAALRLAEAEARLEEARLFEEFHELDRHMGGPVHHPVEDDLVERIVEGMEEEFYTRAFSRDDWRLLTGTLRVIKKTWRARELESERHARLAKRYRREAESARRQALDRWIAVQNPETKPISTIG